MALGPSSVHSEDGTVDGRVLHAPLNPAWEHRHDTRLTDALYLALAEQLGFGLVTTDARLARAGSASDLIIPLHV
ncbi:hypothetical protein [Jiangella anatolica]|uniref:PIN domain-containing protein n=1 Tax=Jiangella anatolica TaxID=2670374 RepID=A0A2W2B0M7_9ACTN|nr:hypothetical protein [Jiangella anatolica]PZF80995.1 hypothetical protein C1I92_23085 [Jiangella anatolica]